jgi:hypothetical protein
MLQITRNHLVDRQPRREHIKRRPRELEDLVRGLHPGPGERGRLHVVQLGAALGEILFGLLVLVPAFALLTLGAGVDLVDRTLVVVPALHGVVAGVFHGLRRHVVHIERSALLLQIRTKEVFLRVPVHEGVVQEGLHLGPRLAHGQLPDCETVLLAAASLVA